MLHTKRANAGELHNGLESAPKMRRVDGVANRSETSQGHDEEGESNEDDEDDEDDDEEEEEEEEEDDDEEEDEEEEDDGEDDEFANGKRVFNDDEEFQLSYKYRELNQDLDLQRSKLASEEGVGLVKKQLNAADSLFEGTKTSSNTLILAKDSATLNEIGKQAKIATQNVKFGQSEKTIKFETFVSSWMNCFGTITQQQGINYAIDDNHPSAKYNWSNAGLLFGSMSKHIMGCDFMLGPLEIEKKKRIIKQRLVDDSKQKTTKTADLRNADDVVNKDTKDDTSKAAERFFIRLKQHDKKISLFEAVLHPKSFGRTIECLFVCSFLINNGLLIMNKYDNGIPYLELTNKENIQQQPRYKNNDDGKSHIIFNLDEKTWRQLVEVYQIKEPFFTNTEV